MRRATVLVAAVALVVASCATVSSVWSSKDQERFAAGVAAFSGGDYPLAHQELSWVAQNFGHQPDGQRAVLLLSALEIDPRNPNRRPEVAAGLAAGYLQLPAREKWLEPLAQTLYLTGLELGTVEQRAEQEQSELPRLPGPTVSSRIRSVEQERDRLAKRVSALEEQLAEKDRELQRIRRTVKQ